MSKNKSFSETTVGRYSLALFELSKENNSTEVIEQQSYSLLNLIKINNEFDYFIKNPTNSKREQLNTIQLICKQFKINDLLKKFMSFLIDKRRFFYVEKILRNFLEICSEKRGEIKAELTSAKIMTEDEISNIKNDLKKTFDSKIKLNFKTDQSLIGGLIIQVGSVMIDTSIKNKLQKVEKNMIGA